MLQKKMAHKLQMPVYANRLSVAVVVRTVVDFIRKSNYQNAIKKPLD